MTDTDYQRRDITTNLTTGVVTVANAGGFNFADATTKRADGFIQDEIKLFDNRWILTPGVRYATYELDPRPNPFYQSVPGEGAAGHPERKAGQAARIGVARQ